MGKGLLFIVGAVFFSASSLLFESRKSAFDTEQEQSEYEYQVITRDIAESGYDQALSDVRRALMNVEHIRHGFSVEKRTASVGKFVFWGFFKK